MIKLKGYVLAAFFLILSFGSLVRAGHIYSWDVDIDKQTVGYASKFRLFFSLESGLSKSGFIYIVSPMSWGTNGVIKATVYSVGETRAVIGTPNVGNSGSAEKNYFFNVNADLLANTWYEIEIIVDSSTLVNQVAGLYNPIQFYTVSDGVSNTNRIIYDSNAAFAVFQIAPAPPLTLGVSISYVLATQTADRNMIGKSYSIYMDITPKVPVKRGALLIVTHDNEFFKFFGTCVNEARVCPVNVTCTPIKELDNKNCILDTRNPKTLNFYIYDDIAADVTFRIKTDILNPTHNPGVSGALEFLVQSRFANLLLEKKVTDKIFTVNPLTGATSSFKYIWGIAPSESATTICPLGLYKSDGTVDIYNDWNIIFSITSATPSNQNLQVDVSYPDNSQVLLGSVWTDLPLFAGKSMEISDITADKKIYLKNIGPLAARSYNIKVKIRLSSTAANGNTGAVNIVALDNSGAVLGNTIYSSAAAAFTVTTNTPYLDNGDAAGVHNNRYSSNYLWAVGLQPGQTLDRAFKTGLYAATGFQGIAVGPSIAIEAIVLLITPTPAQISTPTCVNVMIKIVANNNMLDLGLTSGMGVKIYGTFWGGCANNQICINSAFSGTALEARRNQWKISDQGYAHLSFTCIQNKDDSTFLDSSCTAISQTTGSAFSGLAILKNPSVSSIFRQNQDSVSSVYGGQGVLDFVVCFSSANTDRTDLNVDSSWTLKTSSLLNTWVINQAMEQATIKAAFVNYHMGAGLAASMYESFPLLLRISGRFNALSGTANHLSVFLDNMLDLSNSMTKGNCVSTFAGSTCIPYPASLASNSFVHKFSQRVDLLYVNIANGRTFDYFVPLALASPTSSAPLYIDIGTLVTSTSSDFRFPTLVSLTRAIGPKWGQDFSRTAYAASANIITVTSTAASNIGPSGATTCDATKLGFDNSQINWRAGYTFVSGMIINALETACISYVNSNIALSNHLNGGSGFSFYSSSFDLVKQSVIGWTFQESNCYKISYPRNAKNVIGVHCTLNPSSSNSISNGVALTLTPFTIPWQWGESVTSNYLDTRFLWSVAEYLSAYKVQPANGGLAYQTTCESSAWSNIFLSTNGQRISFTFRPSAGIDLTSGGFVVKAFSVKTGTGRAFRTTCDITLTDGVGACASSVSGSDVIFTITPTTNSKSLGANTQTIYSWVDQGAADNSIVRTSLDISFNGRKIDECNKAETRLVPSSSDSDVGALTISSVRTIPSKNTRSEFSFTFYVTATTRKIWKDSSFVFTLGWLSENLGPSGSNLNCQVYADGRTSFDWKSITISGTFEVAPRSDLNTVSVYTLKCLGGYSSSLVSTSGLSGVWKDGSVDYVTSNTINKPTSFSDLKTWAADKFKLISKLWNSPGFEATYTLNFTLYHFNYTSAARLYVEFSKDLLPRLNRFGSVPDCYLDEVKVFCAYTYDRRLLIDPGKSLDANLTIPYQLIIYGIAQPLALGTYKKIFLGVDADSDPNNGISEWGEIEDVSPSLATGMVGMGITEMIFSSGSTRASQSITMNISLPTGTLTATGTIYVEFPNFYREVFGVSPSISCRLRRQYDENNTDFAVNCSTVRNRRVKIFTSLDTVNSLRSEVYTLTLDNVPTPQYPSPRAPNYITVFLADSKEESIRARTAAGNINSTFGNYSHDNNVLTVNWYTGEQNNYKQVDLDSNVECFMGYYKPVLYLGASRAPNIPYQFQLTGTTISSLPKIVSVPIGSQYTSFKIGAPANMQPGTYIVSSTKEGDTDRQISSLPLLSVSVKNVSCSIAPLNSFYELPLGGRTLPIIFEFAECFPFNGVSVKAQLASDETFGVSFSGEKVSTRDLKNTDYPNTRIYFQLTSSNLTAPVGSIISVNWTFSGSDATAFSTPPNIQIRLVESGITNDPPVVTQVTASVDKNTAKLSVACSQSGFFYYAIGADASPGFFSQADIYNRTEARNIMMTNRNASDPNWLVFGYQSFLISRNSPVSEVRFSGLKSNSNYSAVVFCTNQANKVSVFAGEARWKQPDNGGRIVKAVLNFSSIVSNSIQTDFACAFAKLLSFPTDRIVTQSGDRCQIDVAKSRILQTNSSNSSNASNSSNSSNSSSSNSSSASNTSTAPSTPGVFYYYQIYFYPDLSASAYSLHQSIIQRLNTSDIAADLVKLVASANSSNFPKLNSLNVYLKEMNSSIDYTSQSPAPQLLAGQLTYSSNQVTLSIGISNIDGYVFAGLANETAPVPSFQELRQGLSGAVVSTVNNVTTTLRSNLDSFFWVFLNRNSTYSIALQGKDMSSKNWKVVYAASNDDPGVEVKYTDVNVMWMNLTAKFAEKLVSMIVPLLIGWAALFIL